MSIIDSIKSLFGSAHSKLPDNLNSVEEVRTKAAELAGQHGDTINNAADSLKQRIPGEVDDKVIGAAQDQLNKLGQK